MSSLPIPTVIKEVVNNDLCIGCGMCVQACPSEAIDMQWNEYGFLVAKETQNQCDSDGSCIKVCPFNPMPLPGLKNEDEMANIYLEDATEKHPKIGRYKNIYAGYSKNFRATSSSGGTATYIYEQLFNDGLIDHVVTVSGSENGSAYFNYHIVSNINDLLATSKTRYYPVTLSEAMKKIKALDGKVAISGVGCFIKSIRLAQAHDPVLKEKIVFLVGIICGGVKSSFFTEYLASRAGVPAESVESPEYRVKDPESTATDYSFSCYNKDRGSLATIKMREVGDMWGSGLFKANACDFCDDVTTELADISLGDAWLEPFNKDGNGHNVIVTRTSLADAILAKGKERDELKLESLTLDKFLTSQQGSFNHRHDGLATRITFANKAGMKTPPKRHSQFKLPFYLNWVQRARRAARIGSLRTWEKYRNSEDFDKEMKTILLALKIVTRTSHAIRKITRLVGASK